MLRWRPMLIINLRFMDQSFKNRNPEEFNSVHWNQYWLGVHSVLEGFKFIQSEISVNLETYYFTMSSLIDLSLCISCETFCRQQPDTLVSISQIKPDFWEINACVNLKDCFPAWGMFQHEECVNYTLLMCVERSHCFKITWKVIFVPTFVTTGLSRYTFLSDYLTDLYTGKSKKKLPKIASSWDWTQDQWIITLTLYWLC